MNQPLPPPRPALDQRRDDDEPSPPWPWQPPASGQARRAHRLATEYPPLDPGARELARVWFK